MKVAVVATTQSVPSDEGSGMIMAKNTEFSGLTSQEAVRQLREDGPNELPAPKSQSFVRQIWSVVREPMLLLLLAAGTVNFLLAEPLDGGILMTSVVVVIFISAYQNHKTENALAALGNLSSPRALVMRDGRQILIAGRDVARGDVALLAEGDRVPADAILLDAVNFTVDESALSGESVPVRKVAVGAEQGSMKMGRPCGEATPWVFSGTLVVKGHGIAIVQATGSRTEMGRIGSALNDFKPERTSVRGEIDRLIRIVAFIALGVAAIVVIVYHQTRGNWLNGFLAGIATAMALVPEEFPVVLTIFLALGAWRMSQRRVLTRRSGVIETLGSATVICVDKTGTLTMNSMKVHEFIVDGIVHVLDGSPLPDAFHEIAEFGRLASPIDPFDPMDRAFTDLGGEYLADSVHLHTRWELVREYPLSEELLALAHVWYSANQNEYVVAAKGAPEAISSLCHLSSTEHVGLMKQVEIATAGGLRVLAVAQTRFLQSHDLPKGAHDFDFKLLGLAGLQDPVRPGVADAIADCARAGVRIVMITGDYPGTALAIAREVGINAAEYCTGSDLESMDEEELALRIRTVSVFARMVPEQKLRLIRALKFNGEVVGMTGDGVNDAPALLAADIGIAMGARGTDVARESAALVITDDDFASIAEGIRHGRGIFDKLRKAMSYIIAVHVPIFGMSLIPVFVPGWPLVLLPVQIAFLQLIIDPACSVVFESEEIDPEIMNQRPRKVGETMFNKRVLMISGFQGLSMLLAVFAVYLWQVLGERPAEVTRSVTFATLVIGNLALILVNRSWHLSIWESFRKRKNPSLKWIMSATLILLTLFMSVPTLRDAFQFGPLSPADCLLALVAGFLGVAWFEAFKKWERHMGGM
jgi:Ca2+-transporting ATPase